MHSFHIVSVSTRTTKTTLFGFDSQKSKISLNLLVFTFPLLDASHPGRCRVCMGSDVSAFFFRFFFFNLHVLEWGHTCAVQDKIYIISWYFWDEKSDFSIHFDPELTVLTVGGPEYFRPATENAPKSHPNVKICELRQQN